LPQGQLARRFLSGQKHILHFKNSDGKSPCREDFQNLAVSGPKGNDAVLDPVLSCGFYRFHIHCPFCSRDRFWGVLPFPLFIWTAGFFVRLLECPAVRAFLRSCRGRIQRQIGQYGLFVLFGPQKNLASPLNTALKKHKLLKNR